MDSTGQPVNSIPVIETCYEYQGQRFLYRSGGAVYKRLWQDLFHGLGLDYRNSAFAATDGSVGDVYAMRFAKTDDLPLEIPDRSLANRAGEPSHYHPDGMTRPSQWNPFLGNGFVGRGGQAVIPEYHVAVPVTAVPDGAEMWRITADGREELVAVLQERRWLPLVSS